VLNVGLGGPMLCTRGVLSVQVFSTNSANKLGSHKIM